MFSRAFRDALTKEIVLIEMILRATPQLLRQVE
jgi:hypothetical protein